MRIQRVRVSARNADRQTAHQSGLLYPVTFVQMAFVLPPYSCSGGHGKRQELFDSQKLDEVSIGRRVSGEPDCLRGLPTMIRRMKENVC